MNTCTIESPNSEVTFFIHKVNLIRICYEHDKIELMIYVGNQCIVLNFKDIQLAENEYNKVVASMKKERKYR